MNKVNGYCQIELPDRFNLNDLTPNPVSLTKEEAKPIIDKLGLGGIKLPEDERSRDAIYKMVVDALIRKPAYIVTRSSLYDRYFIAPAMVADEAETGDAIVVSAVVEKSGNIVHIIMSTDLTTLLDPETTPTIYDLEFAIWAKKITTTNN